MTTLDAVARGVKIFALLSNIPPGTQTVVPRALLEGAAVPGPNTHQTPEYLVSFFTSKLKFYHTIRYDNKAQTWTFYRPRGGELLS